jgi:hypothetical protein
MKVVGVFVRFVALQRRQVPKGFRVSALSMAITDFEPNEAAVVLEYKLSDLNEAKFNRFQTICLSIKSVEEYPEIGMQALFHINQLLLKPTTGNFKMRSHCYRIFNDTFKEEATKK